ncbi:efflux transporter [Bacteroides reticulotermitis JCM 10512]|uniref:Efflux transporter n=2 Tax=Bacteroides reticulotermitis TaxID=1133319 RepID=W4UXQ7_9BACE|nr:efflux transporter [Bacteroides reticulotermitis JCM 10512]
MALLFTSCGNKDNSTRQVVAQKYPTTVVSEKTEKLLSVYPATVKGQEDIEIRPRIDGFIDAINVDEGAVVRKGQTLFRINSPQAEQALTTAEASLQSAKAQVNTAKVNVNRIRPLAEKGIIGKVQLETAEDSYQSALAGLAQAEAALKNARATIGWTQVTSPVDGFVGSIPFRLGSLVSSANVLTTVANTGNVFAHFSLNEKQLVTFLNTLEGNTQAEKIKNAPPVTLTLADGTVYEHEGKIGTITGSINITTGSANFRAEFPNKEGKLRSGTSGKVSVPRVIEKAIVIPQKATFSQQDKIVLFLAQGDSVVQKAISVLPTPDGKSYVVTDGLTVGDRIVTDGVATLSHGKKIHFD